MTKKYGKYPSSNGKTKTPTRRDAVTHDLIRGKSNKSFVLVNGKAVPIYRKK